MHAYDAVFYQHGGLETYMERATQASTGLETYKERATQASAGLAKHYSRIPKHSVVTCYKKISTLSTYFIL
jgi:hypothetical protein